MTNNRMLDAVEQDHPRLARVDGPELAADRVHRELADLTGQLHPDKAGAGHREGQPLPALFGIPS